MRIVLVSMSTGRASDSAADHRQQAVVNTRSAEFAGLLDVTGPNKRMFADLHGYAYVDASNLLDDSRPASWSKIPAVLSVLDQYDWIFWLDADTLITNLTTPLEALLPPPLEPEGAGASGKRGGSAAPDLLLTADSTGVNAGVWLIRGRGCSWCRAFLQRWWGMEGFIRRGPGDTKSGDNDALKYMVSTMDSSELTGHVGLAPQCAFNSYLWRGSLRNMARYVINPRRVLMGLWQPGDFVLHAAGMHNKLAVLQGFMQRQMGQEQQTQARGRQLQPAGAPAPSASTGWAGAGMSREGVVAGAGLAARGGGGGSGVAAGAAAQNAGGGITGRELLRFAPGQKLTQQQQQLARAGAGAGGVKPLEGQLDGAAGLGFKGEDRAVDGEGGVRLRAHEGSGQGGDGEEGRPTGHSGRITRRGSGREGGDGTVAAGSGGDAIRLGNLGSAVAASRGGAVSGLGGGRQGKAGERLPRRLASRRAHRGSMLRRGAG